MGNQGGKEAGWKYLLLALGAFAGLALEAVHAYGWEPLVYGGLPLSAYSTWQAVLHWCLTCVAWICAGWFLVRLARRKLGFDLFAKGKLMRFWQIIAILVGIAISVTISYLDWGGYKAVKEYEHNGTVKFIFQYIYYFAETGMILLIIIFGQRAFEIWTKKKSIPWGGMLCALTWGIAHLISRGYFDPANGLLSMLSGFLFGAAYLLTNRDAKISWIVLFLMFAF